MVPSIQNCIRPLDGWLVILGRHFYSTTTTKTMTIDLVADGNKENRPTDGINQLEIDGREEETVFLDRKKKRKRGEKNETIVM